MTRILTIDDLQDAIREAGEMAAELAACSREDDDAQPLPSGRTGRTPVLECVQASLAAHAKLLDQSIGQSPGKTLPPEETDVTYHGSWDDEGRLVRVSGTREGTRGLRAQTDITRKHAVPFIWGEECPGALELALAIMVDATGDENGSFRHRERFQAEVIARLPHEWSITRGQVWSWRRDHPPRSIMPPLWRPEG